MLHTNKGLFSAVNSHMCFQMGRYITRVATLVTIVFFFALLGRGSRDRPSATSSQTADRFWVAFVFLNPMINYKVRGIFNIVDLALAVTLSQNI